MFSGGNATEGENASERDSESERKRDIGLVTFLNKSASLLRDNSCNFSFSTESIFDQIKPNENIIHSISLNRQVHKIAAFPQNLHVKCFLLTLLIIHEKKLFASQL